MECPIILPSPSPPPPPSTVMGSCLSNSTSASPPPPPSAKVISFEGYLREYPVPISVSRVLQTEDSSASTSDSFLCNSDSLYYDEFIPALSFHDLLQPNHIYFLLPSSRLHSRLTAADMATLAVKASRALLQNASSSSTRKKGGRVSPVLVPNHPSDHDDQLGKKINNAPPSSVKKLQRLTSRRAKLAVRSFKLRLTTIYEGTVM